MKMERENITETKEEKEKEERQEGLKKRGNKWREIGR